MHRLTLSESVGEKGNFIEKEKLIYMIRKSWNSVKHNEEKGLENLILTWLTESKRNRWKQETLENC